MEVLKANSHYDYYSYFPGRLLLKSASLILGVGREIYLYLKEKLN
jgi:hypothetical protein